MICSNCGTENRPGRKFCSSCGVSLAVICAACGAANDAGDRFCGDCGAALGAAVGSVPAPAIAPMVAERAGASERRLVSVLFADLVGFTTLSEARDAEEVRELLTRYFETCKRLIARYGGVVEKFIGDAVMAVWGTPVAQEDDAERAVRAALDLVAAVAEMGREAEVDGLRARAGVLTGEAAVTFGASGEGMVAGDLVNTASRIQASAEPGSVFVGDASRDATEAAIVYEEAGTFEIKGKAEPLRLWRALRIVAGVGGAMKSEGLEAPFVGRDREARLMKELFHGSADERKAHLVSVIGIAGIGKSRLGWEFYKYTDGLQEEAWWHRGRCLAYGEGVTYYALVEHWEDVDVRLPGARLIGRAGLAAHRQHGRARLERHGAALLGGIANEDERPGRRIDLLAGDGERRVAGEHEVQLLMAGGHLVVLGDHRGAGLARRPRVDPKRLHVELLPDRRPPVRPLEVGDRRRPM